MPPLGLPTDLLSAYHRLASVESFRNEKEVRFVCGGEALAAVSISLASLKDHIGLRLSPDASRDHIDAVRETWIKWGGSDRYQIAGE